MNEMNPLKHTDDNRSTFDDNCCKCDSSSWTSVEIFRSSEFLLAALNAVLNRGLPVGESSLNILGIGHNRLGRRLRSNDIIVSKMNSGFEP